MILFQSASLLAALALSTISFVNANVPPIQSRQANACVNATFSGLTSLPSGTTIFIERVEHISQGANFTEDGNLSFAGVTNLPPLCAAIINVTDKSVSPQSNYRFGIFLPDNWNSRILTIGSESFAGGINWPGMGEGVHYNMATISTDNGHNSTQPNMTWAFGNEATRLDWGYRAVHGSVQIAKNLTKAYYQKNINHSYYSGCSTGGRQGLKEIQISPESFDGALIGAPAWNTKFLMPWITKMALDQLHVSPENRSEAGFFGGLNVLWSFAYSVCDGVDGHKDGIVSLPEKCSIDLILEQSRCTNASTNSFCLNDTQIALARGIYSDYITSDGTFVQNGYYPTSETQWISYLFSSSLVGFDAEYERNFLYNNKSWATIDYSDQDAHNSINLNPGNATADNFNISAFKNRGGKIIMYHGMADGIVPTKSSLHFYNETKNAMPGTNMDEFFRYFQVPGLSHCFNTNPSIYNFAPWMFGAYGQATVVKANFSEGWSVPGHRNDSRYDALAALVDWTENGGSVDQIIATTWNLTDNTEYRSRPICKWPNFATTSVADSDTVKFNNASSWTCTAPS